MPLFKLILLAGAGASMLTGCATQQAATLPAAPSSFAAAQAQNLALTSNADAPWLAAFASPELTGLVEEALQANPTLLTTQARAEAAAERARGIASRALPDLNLNFGASRTETPVAGGTDLATEILTSGATASWEADLWGRVRSQTAASNRDAQASARDAQAALLSVTGQTASAWVNLAAAQQRLELAREDLSTRERALTITERRYEQGVLTALSLRTARSQTASARASEASAVDAVATASRRLQVLLGRYPDGALRVEGALPVLTPLAASRAPAAVLQSRPDVLAASARLEAAGFRLSEARAALLPRLTLTGSATGSGAQLADVTDTDDMVRQLIAGLSAPLFQGGALRAEVRASQADQQAAAAQYVGTVLDAWSEVEAAISADAALATQEQEFAIAAEEARSAQELAEREYTRGVATIFELIDAYSRRIDAERALIAATSDRIANRISYHIALGEPGLMPSTTQEQAP